MFIRKRLLAQHKDLATEECGSNYVEKTSGLKGIHVYVAVNFWFQLILQFN